MRAGRGSSDAYLDDWRHEKFTIGSVDDKQALAAKEAALLEAEYTDEVLTTLVRNKGLADPG